MGILKPVGNTLILAMALMVIALILVLVIAPGLLIWELVRSKKEDPT